jgi:photosystem II stability/assembly factor-like uncharacterized protein
MPLLGADQHNTQAFLRAFYQPGAGGPENSVLYGGADMSYIQIEGVSNPILGDYKAQFMHNPRRIGSYVPVATMISPPDLPQAKVTFSEKMGGIPRYLATIGCKANFYEPVGRCKDPGNFLTGWEQYVLIYPQGVVTKVDLGDRSSFEGSALLKGALDVTFSRPLYAVGGLNFGTASTSTDLTALVPVDACYGDNNQCGDCGPANDGSNFIYVAGPGAAAAKPFVEYSTDGGNTWTKLSIAVAVNNEQPSGIAQYQNYLVVVTKTAGSATQGGYYYSDIDPNTGIPNSTFTKVTTGFINSAGKAPNDIYVNSLNQALFPADGGIVYQATDITAGVTVLTNAGATSSNLMRIHGYQETLVAVGASSAVIKSTNFGKTWAATTTAPTTTIGNAVQVIDRQVYWVAGTSGNLFYTRNGGTTWVQKRFSGDGAGTVNDILAATPEVIHFAHVNATPNGRLFTSWNGGFSFTNVAPRLNSVPTTAGITRLACPFSSPDGVASNNLVAVGTGAGGTDGTVLVGTASYI